MFVRLQKCTNVHKQTNKHQNKCKEKKKEKKNSLGDKCNVLFVITPFVGRGLLDKESNVIK